MPQLDEQFALRYRMCHQQWQRRILAGEHPSIIRLGDQLILFYRAERQVAELITERYRQAKQAAHVPLVLYLWLRDVEGQTLSAEDLNRAHALRADILREHEAAQDPALRAIMEASSQLLDASCREQVVPRGAFSTLASAVRRPTQELMLAATRDELQRLHRSVSDWTCGFGAAEWQALRVVVCANHQARYKESTKLYFQRLLSEQHGTGAQGERRVIYAENVADENEAIALLATHALDEQIARAFFGDRGALQVNVLGDAAERVVRELLPD